jgi:hypothetical protein
MWSIHADWGETVPLQEQRTVSQFKTRRDAQRKLGRKALPKRTAAANVARPGIATTGGIFKKAEIERQPQM